MDALDRAIAALGSVTALAKAVGVTSSAPLMWKTRKSVPAQHCPAIEQATGGAVRCEELRPDVLWSVLRNRVA